MHICQFQNYQNPTIGALSCVSELSEVGDAGWWLVGAVAAWWLRLSPPVAGPWAVGLSDVSECGLGASSPQPPAAACLGSRPPPQCAKKSRAVCLCPHPFNTGNCNEGIACHKESLGIQKRLWKDHLSIGQNYYCMATVYHNMGCKEEALRSIFKALDIIERYPTEFYN